MSPTVAFIFGAVFGAAIALVAGMLRIRANRAAMQTQFRDAFSSLAGEALSANNERFLTLAHEALATQTTSGAAELESRKKLIDQSIQQVTGRLEALRGLMGQLESSRKEDYGQLGQRLSEAAQQTSELRLTTENLRAALAHPQRRGQWGERMARDILQMAGMIEGVNFTCQQTVEVTGRRPDFTFNLSSGVKLNMDVKFPLDNYLKLIQADGEAHRQRASEAFCADVRTQVRALCNKDYINTSDGTADFVLMFIPNEQVFATIQELDSTLLSESLQRRVLFVGPLSLLAVLTIARQAAETANLSRQTDEALSLMATFAKQWDIFKAEMDKLEKKLNETVVVFNSLRTTRTNMLDRPLAKLEQLRLNGDGNNCEL